MFQVIRSANQILITMCLMGDEKLIEAVRHFCMTMSIKFMIEKSYGNRKREINYLLDETMSIRVGGAKSLKCLLLISFVIELLL